MVMERVQLEMVEALIRELRNSLPGSEHGLSFEQRGKLERNKTELTRQEGRADELEKIIKAEDQRTDEIQILRFRDAEQAKAVAAAKKLACSSKRLDRESVLEANKIISSGYFGLENNEAVALNYKAADAVVDGLANDKPAVQNAAMTHDLMEVYLLTPEQMKLPPEEKHKILLSRTPEEIKAAEELVKNDLKNAVQQGLSSDASEAEKQGNKFNCKNGKCTVVHEAVSEYHKMHGYREEPSKVKEIMDEKRQEADGKSTDDKQKSTSVDHDSAKIQGVTATTLPKTGKALDKQAGQSHS